MSLATKLHAIRQKPRHVRERYLVLCLIVIAPILIMVWILTFRRDAVKGGTDSLRDMGSTVSESFSSPVYDETFGNPIP